MSNQDIDPIEPTPPRPSDNNVFADSFESKLDPLFRTDNRDLGGRKYYSGAKTFALWSDSF